MTVKPEFADFLERAKASGGAEMANCQPFIERLCGHLNLPQPDLAGPANEINDYVYERRVDHHHPSGKVSARRMDLYKRDCFILEAKQSVARRQAADQLSLHLPDGTTKAGQAPRGGPRWDAMMGAAKAQAEGYARDLPVDHDYPPFLLILDVGNEMQVFADFSGQGRNYTQFPDRKTYRISMDDLLLTDVQARLRAIWMDPASLNPARRSAEVTQDVAERLAIVARRLERRHPAEEVAAFLMRCLFTMFAEDVELIPRRSFETLLERLRGNPAGFVPEVAALWQAMDEGTYAVPISTAVRRFNGSLFKDRKVLELDAEEITELHIAATKDWRDVEPAIFGTLLERALSTRERAKLGAHYTPRVYVERLVVPTIMEPLREDWAVTRAAALEAHGKGDDKGAATLLRGFARQLADTHVLDPACGTGNFLYVALEMMKRLEGEVLDTVEHFGIGEGLAMRGASVTPAQFHGIEINPRAAAIADLVLWIGYLKLQLRTVDATQLGDPVLERFGTIEHRDALLVHDGTDPVTDEAGEPVMVWDRIGTRPHPTLAGAVVPDRQATAPMVRYRKPQQAPWPEVEFIVGNPPFIGGKDLRAELGDGYAEAIWAANREVPGGADFVMQWWDRAAERLRRKGRKGEPNRLRRFGFITTNSITQTFSRRVVERHLKAKDPVQLVYAVADHPWMKMAGRRGGAHRADGRGGRRGGGGLGARGSGREAQYRRAGGGAGNGARDDHGEADAWGGCDGGGGSLWANEALSSRQGLKLHGAGFIVTPAKAAALGLGRVPGLEDHILPYRNGRDLAQRSRGVMVIDLYGLSDREVMERFPAVYEHVAETVKPERGREQAGHLSTRQLVAVRGAAIPTWRPSARHSLNPATSPPSRRRGIGRSASSTPRSGRTISLSPSGWTIRRRWRSCPRGCTFSLPSRREAGWVSGTIPSTQRPRPSTRSHSPCRIPPPALRSPISAPGSTHTAPNASRRMIT